MFYTKILILIEQIRGLMVPETLETMMMPVESYHNFGVSLKDNIRI